MAKRARFLIIAILLTVLDVALFACYVWRVWAEWSGDVWNLGLSALPVALGATSLVNVWAEVVLTQGVLAGIRSASHRQTEAPVPAQTRGLADV